VGMSRIKKVLVKSLVCREHKEAKSCNMMVMLIWGHICVYAYADYK